MDASLLDLEFSDLSYTAGRKTIIKSISGQFRGGELTAIMGPSGAGKSSLMNILVGYVTSGVSGQIRTNGEPRRLGAFNRMCSYILQEDLLPPSLTVREAMMYAARLKLPHSMPLADKQAAVEEIMTTLGLQKCSKTMTTKLSGGQRKRVSVCLELVSNPQVVFLDEPTTGLDSVSIKQTMELLWTLSRQGRTVICTLHQPTSALFHLIDRVYIVSRGQCVFQGAPTRLVPFLSGLGHVCPETHNPADFVMEILNPELSKQMAEELQNGKIIQSANGPIHIESARRPELTPPVATPYAAPFCNQFSLLLSRMSLQKRRHKTGLWLQFVHHVISALLISGIFRGVGSDAGRPYENFKFNLCVLVFFMYTHVMIPVLAYPNEVKMMKREFFNGWYSLRAWYLAKSLSTAPVTAILSVMFVLIVYLLTDQPLEARRFAYFLFASVFTAYTSEGLGILIGFIYNPTNGAVVGPITMSPILMLAMHGMGYGQKIIPLMYYLMKASYLRFALVAQITALYLDDRVTECSELEGGMCFYKDGEVLVRDLGMAGEQPLSQMYGLIFYLFFLRIAAFFALRYRVTTEFTNTLFLYMAKILKKK